MVDELNPYLMAQKQLAIAAEKIGLAPNIHEFLRHIQRIMIVSIPIIKDNGELRVFTGYRAQHTFTRGPGKGGIRFDADLTLEDVMALSIWMTWKCSLMGLPFSGAKGGVVINPDEFSRHEVERVTRRYASEIRNIIGPDKDILAPDLNTGPREMAWIMDTYSMDSGTTITGVVTGKPVEVGGSLGRQTSTGQGVFFVVRRLLEKLNKNINDINFVIQGFGNVGSAVAQSVFKAGGRILALSDISGGIYNPDGINPEEIQKYITKNKFLKGFPGGKPVDNAELLELECDILIPAARENQITRVNASRLNTKIIIEAANGPTTTDADEILHDRGIIVVPDILANAGGVIVSYFEWLQDIQSYFWDLDRIHQELERIMLRAFEEVWDVYKSEKCTMRLAAYMIAVSRVAKAVELRGIFP